MTEEKTPQNIQELVGEIGERLVLFNLFAEAHERPYLEIFKNYSESGYDIGIHNHRTKKKVKIEVKTRQRRITTNRDPYDAHFTLTQNERDNADFLVGYWLEHNSYFIVPINELDEMRNGKHKDGTPRFVHKHIVRKSSVTGEYTDKSIPWLNSWNLILDFVDPIKPKRKK